MSEATPWLVALAGFVLWQKNKTKNAGMAVNHTTAIQHASGEQSLVTPVGQTPSGALINQVITVNADGSQSHAVAVTQAVPGTNTVAASAAPVVSGQVQAGGAAQPILVSTTSNGDGTVTVTQAPANGSAAPTSTVAAGITRSNSTTRPYSFFYTYNSAVAPTPSNTNNFDVTVPAGVYVTGGGTAAAVARALPVIGIPGSSSAAIISLLQPGAKAPTYYLVNNGATGQITQLTPAQYAQLKPMLQDYVTGQQWFTQDYGNTTPFNTADLRAMAIAASVSQGFHPAATAASSLQGVASSMGLGVVVPG